GEALLQNQPPAPPASLKLFLPRPPLSDPFRQAALACWAISASTTSAIFCCWRRGNLEASSKTCCNRPLAACFLGLGGLTPSNSSTLTLSAWASGGRTPPRGGLSHRSQKAMLD